MQFTDLHSSLLDFWLLHGISEKDLLCRNCYILMVNYDEVKNVIVKTNEKGYVFYDTKLKKTYIESPQNRWCVKGRTLSGKTYFRHLCWNCLKKEIAYAIENQNTLHLMSFEIFRQWDRLLRNCKLK